jgi:hypothetical protein
MPDEELSGFRVLTGTGPRSSCKSGACIVASVALKGAMVILADMLFIPGGFAS